MIRSLDRYNDNIIQTSDPFLRVISKLPSEVLQAILLNLKPKDIQKAALVSRQWKKDSILTAQKVFFLSQDFARLLGNHLPQEYSTQKERLLAISTNKEIITFTSLVSTRDFIDEFKEKVLHVLQELKAEDLNKIDELTKYEIKPKFFEYIFDLVTFYRGIKEAIEKIKAECLEDLSEDVDVDYEDFDPQEKDELWGGLGVLI